MKKFVFIPMASSIITLLLTACNGSPGIANPNTGTGEALRGADSSGGADLRGPYDGAAWFLGKGKSVHVCFEAASEFPFYEDGPAALISKSFAQWKAYYESKEQPMTNPKNIRIIDATGDFPKFPGFALDPMIEQAAPGACASRNPDLTFYFGVHNSLVDQAHLSNPNALAFASRISYDPVTEWGKGFVFLDLPYGSKYYWPDEDAEYGIILHEMGHVLGCAHVSGTIMDADITNNLTQINSTEPTPQDRRVKLTKIDQDRELIQGDNYNYTVSGLGSIEEGKLYNSSVTAFFSHVMGRSIHGTLILRLNRKAEYLSNITLTIGDDLGTTSFDMGQKGGQVFKSGASVFHTALGKQNENGTAVYPSGMDGGQAAIEYASLITPSGNYRVTITWNEGENRGSLTRSMIGFSPISVMFTPSGQDDPVMSVFLQSSNWL